MTRWTTFAATFLAIMTLSQPQAKQLAISFDDSPRTANGYLNGPERAHKLLAALKNNGVDQSAFFSVTSRLDSEGRKRLKSYSDAGHIIANHTHTHPDLNKMSLHDYIAEIEQAHKALASYPTFKSWFRFPYLREGDTPEKRDGMRVWFEQNDYLNAYITLNNYDWYIESLFQNAIKNHQQVDFEALEHFYVDTIIEGIDFYDGLANKYLSRSPKHVLLLHENDIAALFVGKLVQKLKKQGWEIIPITAAYDDKIADYHLERTLRYNPGRIGEIALDKGMSKGLWHQTLDEDYLKQQFEQNVLKRSK